VASVVHYMDSLNAQMDRIPAAEILAENDEEILRQETA